MMISIDGQTSPFASVFMFMCMIYKIKPLAGVTVSIHCVKNCNLITYILPGLQIDIIVTLYRCQLIMFEYHLVVGTVVLLF